MSIPFQLCEVKACDRDAWFLCRRCLRWLCQTHEPEQTHDCKPAISVEEAMDEIAAGTFLDGFTEQRGEHPLPPAPAEFAAAPVRPTRWKMFEPCKVGDHHDCAAYDFDEHADRQCSSECHSWDEDDPDADARNW